MVAPAPRLSGGGAAAGGRRPARAGFTLLEILVVLALIAMITTALIVGISRLLRDKAETADEIFWKTVGQVRKEALQDNRDIRLTFDPKTQAFVAGSGDQAEQFAFAPSNPVEFTFLAPASAAGSSTSILVGGQIVDTQTIPFVTFYGDGTCAPFRVQLKGKDYSTILEIDPWTCAPILKPLPAP